MNMHKFSSKLARSSLLIFIVYSCTQALAEDVVPYAVTDSELTLLPQACYAKLRGDKATQDLWVQRIGRENFLHLHHYCFALNFMNRAKFTTVKYNKRYYLNQAVTNFAYVLKNWPANSVLRPDAETGMKEAQMMLRALGPQ